MGRIVQRGRVPHICRTPAIREFSYPPRQKKWCPFSDLPPTFKVLYPEGTIWECDCGKTWQVWNKPSQNTGRMVLAGGLSWRPEPAKVKRKRLGLKWWQRQR